MYVINRKPKYHNALLLSVALGSPFACALAVEPAAANYPDRPIRLIVPQSPGGGSDLYARMVAQPLAERLGHAIVVDNRAGAGSLIGTETVAKAAPDGYTLLAISSSFTIIPSTYKKVPYDPVKDFAPVTLLTTYPHVVVLHPSVAANSVKELIALAKAKPGALNYASAGVGMPTQLGAELFNSMAGTHIVHVPYKGGGPALTNLIGGQVQAYFGPLATVLPHVKAGKIKAIAVTSIQRWPSLPDLPSVSEAGLPGYRLDAWNGMLAPARTPPAIIKKLNGEINAVLKTSAIRERLAAEGVGPGGTSSEEMGAMLKSEIAKWAKVIKQAGIEPE
jgi:tripartite-type tricarboxylate transporter receptor subunit TctC